MDDVRPQNFDLAAALRDSEERFAAANPLSAVAFEAAKQTLPGGNTRTVLFYPPFPTYIVRGEDCRLWDADGHRYIDFQVEQTAGMYGHSHPAILRALSMAMQGGLTLGGPTSKEAELAEILCRRFPALDLVRFTNSGTEANLLALSTARAVTGRSKIMVFEGCYHGSVMSFGPYGNQMNIPFPYVMAPYNDTDRTVALIEENAADLAAVIVEPMTGSGGCIPGTFEFLSALRAATEKHGIVLVFDEVMTSRLGPGGYQKVIGITPDMMSVGKYVGGGLSFGAFGGRADLMARFDPATPGAFAHAGTFNNNVLSLSAGVAGLSEAYTEAEATRLNADGETLRARLNEVIAKHGVPAQVTGYGSMMMLHLTDKPLRGPVDSGQVPAAARALFHLEMMARAHYVARRNMIVLSLPMTQAEFDGLVAAVDDFMSTYKGVLTAA